MTEVVAYARFSSDNQRSESIDAQLRAIRKFCEDNNYNILTCYVDEAKSATTDRRPAFQEMIDDAVKGEFEKIVIHKLDRFARNRKDSIVYKALLKEYGVEVVSVTEPLSSSPESVILESVLEGMAEYYSLNLSREVKKGQKENALQCKTIGGTPPLGYDVDKNTLKFVINEHEATAVRYIFQSVLNGIGYKQIIAQLNAWGYRTKAGNPFAVTSLNSILRNPKYKGEYRYCQDVGKDMVKRRAAHKDYESDAVIRKKGGVPAIISERDFDKVQQIMDDRRIRDTSANAKENYLLSGKVRCGECGASYCGS
ncbi:MAG: recombinase family protein, partial [Lachnospiraceae bacterium]|nr:recombinase family protein [Lachnospiraceae bacterium]